MTLSLSLLWLPKGVATPPGPVRELSGRRAPLYFAVALLCAVPPKSIGKWKSNGHCVTRHATSSALLRPGLLWLRSFFCIQSSDDHKNNPNPKRWRRFSHPTLNLLSRRRRWPQKISDTTTRTHCLQLVWKKIHQNEEPSTTSFEPLARPLLSIRLPRWAPRTTSLATTGPINKRSSLQPARDGPRGAREASSSSATRSSHDYNPSSASSLLTRWTLKTRWRRRWYPRNYPRLTLDESSTSVFLSLFLVFPLNPISAMLIWKLAIFFSKLKKVSSPFFRVWLSGCRPNWQEELTAASHGPSNLTKSWHDDE